MNPFRRFMTTLSLGASCSLAYYFGQNAGGWPLALLLILSLMAMTFWSLTGWDAEPHDSDVVEINPKMSDAVGRNEQRRITASMVLISLAIYAYLYSGLGAVFLLPVAFLAGIMFAGGRIPLLQYPEDAEREGREVLERIEAGDVERIWKIALEGRKIEAIKELRAINHDGLKEAKNAVELLLKSGKNWRSTE